MYVESKVLSYKIGSTCQTKIGFKYIDPILGAP
jgi:hypothetical protein